LVTGGLALDDGLIAALQESIEEQKINVTVRSHPDSPYAGAIGAALWGVFRYEKLEAEGRFAKAS
jgi:benzoyl-CoA reductase subunit D